MADQWIYRSLGQEFGPFSFDILIELAKKGTVTAEDEVKLGVDGKWRRAGSIGRLVAVLPFVVPTKSVTPASIAIPQEKPVALAAAVPAATPTRPKSNPAVATVAAEQAKAPVAKTTPRKSTPIIQVPAETKAIAPAVVASAPKPEPIPAAPARPTDDEMAAQIEEALQSRNIPSLARIAVDVRNGVITARGSLNSEGERLLAVRLLQQTTGAVEVIDQLNVSQPGPASRPNPVSRPMPVKAVRAPSAPRNSGPGLFSQLLDNLKGEYRNHAIGAAVATVLLGFFFFPRGPVRPVAVHPVKGKVILDGQPLANAAIVLHRVGESKLPANLHPRAKATEDGTFLLETFDAADGAPDGEFVATVFLTEESIVDGEKQAGPNLLPTVYSRPETSPFKIRITSSTKELQPLELTKS